MIDKLFETGPADVDHALRVSPFPTAGPVFGSLIMEAKQCSKCKQIKALSAFCCHRRHADGLRSDCRECQREACRQWRAENRERAVQSSRRNYAENRERFIEMNRQWRARHPLANSASFRVLYAIRTGKLVPQPCEVCGADEDVHAHHDDYTKPLDLRWLCRKHHQRLHAGSPSPAGENSAAGMKLFDK